MDKNQFSTLLKTAYEQGYYNGFCDSEECLKMRSCSGDWLSEVLADGEIADVEIPNLD